MLCFYAYQRLYPITQWQAMNYGYALLSIDGKMIDLEEDDEYERFPLQLYYFITFSELLYSVIIYYRDGQLFRHEQQEDSRDWIWERRRSQLPNKDR